LIAIAKDGRAGILENANARVEHVIRFAPTKTVTVKVVDSAQNPVVGASLRALGWWQDHVSKQKALTNENGEVKLRLEGRWAISTQEIGRILGNRCRW
jgi:hypothetical protein